MGMDLHPFNPDDEAPRDDEGNLKTLQFNLSGWATLRAWLYAMGVDVSQFATYNDEGTLINESTCRRVAEVIESHLGRMDDENRAWLEPQIPYWRHCGGFRQW